MKTIILDDMEQITISKEVLTNLLKHSQALVNYLIDDESNHYVECGHPEDHIYNDVFKVKQLVKSLDKIDVESYIKDRLEYYDSNCTESEIWVDPITGDYYDVDVEHVRDFSNLTDRKRK